MSKNVGLIVAVGLLVVATVLAQDPPPEPWAHIVKLTPFDAARLDEFGFSVSISGDTAVVGSIFDDQEAGSAYVFERNVGGWNNWGLVEKLTASDPGPGERFGASVSIDGDTLVVGAHTDRVGEYAPGAAYIFQRDQGAENGWVEVAKLIASDGPNLSLFGYAVAISGDTVVVGAYWDGHAGEKSGSAYIFQRDEGGPDTWGEVAKLTAFDAAPYAYFGYGVAISGDTVVVGAYGDQDLAGAAYVFERDEGGAWQDPGTKLVASDAASGDEFGIHVAIDGDTTLVGALYQEDAYDNAGAAYVFQRDQGGAENWGEVTKLSASDARAAVYFGRQVSISGDTAVVGASGYTGAAYFFQRGHGGPNNWGEVAKVTDPDADLWDRFSHVSISGDTAVVGAYYDDNPFDDSGSAHIFQFAGPMLTVPAQSHCAAGESVAFPVALATNGSELFGSAFSIDYDETCLDPIDSDNDGSPDAIPVEVPAGFFNRVFFDLGDGDGEIDVIIAGAPPPLVPLADGPLATVTLTATCTPEAGETVSAPVRFSSDPAASFGDAGGQSLIGMALGGVLEILPGVRGDCNRDGLLDVADLVSCSIEIFDGDGSFWLDAPGGSFAGQPVGCDSNADTLVDAGDLSCTSRLISGLECATGKAHARSGRSPRLLLPVRLPVTGDDLVVVPVRFTAGGHDVNSVAFSLDYDEAILGFDETDSDLDGVPDAVRFLGKHTLQSVRFDPEDRSGELDFLIADLRPQAEPIGEGLLVEVELRLLAPASSLAGWVRFSQEPMASFGDSRGLSIPGGTKLVK